MILERKMFDKPTKTQTSMGKHFIYLLSEQRALS